MMKRAAYATGHADGYDYRVYPGEGGVHAGCIYFMDVGAHPFDGVSATQGLQSTVIALEVMNWDDDMTPWPAVGLYPGDPDFRGQADHTLQVFTDQVIPTVEAAEGLLPSLRALSGYSLGGLFSLYSFLKDPRFCAVASMSGSVWYEGWLNFLLSMDKTHRDLDSCFAYLSIGDRESRAREKILHCVQANTQATVELLSQWGVQTEYRVNRGNHFEHVNERIALGLQSVDKFFSARSRR